MSSYSTMLKEIYNAYGIEGNTLTVFQSDFDVDAR